MKLNFWPFSAINGLREKVERQQQDIVHLTGKIANLRTNHDVLTGKYLKGVAEIEVLSLDLADLRARFAQGLDARGGSILLGGYCSKDRGPGFEAAVGWEVVRSRQVVVFPVPQEDQTKNGMEYMFRVNLVQNR